MTPTATFFLVVVWGVIIVVTGYCFWKLLRSDRQFEDQSD